MPFKTIVVIWIDHRAVLYHIYPNDFCRLGVITLSILSSGAP